MANCVNVADKIAGVRVGREIALALRTFQTLAQIRLRPFSTDTHFSTDHGRFVPTRKHALRKHATRLIARRGKNMGHAKQHSLDYASRGRFTESLRYESRDCAAVTIQNFTEERFFVSESGVKAGALDMHRPRETGKGSAFVPFFPEDVHRGIESLVFIKTARTPKAQRMARLWPTLGPFCGPTFCAYSSHSKQDTPFLYRTVKNVAPFLPLATSCDYGTPSAEQGDM